MPVPDFLTQSVTGGAPTLGGMLLCTVCSLVFGLAVAFVYMFRNKHSKSLAVTLALLPATVQIVIMLVNGNIGAGVAVAGAFSLVRFRSIPGSARDIGSLFFAMALGLATGMGYLFYAFLFLLIVGGAHMLLSVSRFGQGGTDARVLRITIPENLDYDGMFDDLFEKYTRGTELNKVKTTNMGSLYELTYLVRLKGASIPKEFMDELRCRNGNLGILVSCEQRTREEL
ncbi:MAG: DUF4956 domain-containing protein [Coriobacteriales bacterium]|nr:DUF4956 domain-containing protein [Coriobacteriales bacterium]